MADYTYTIRCVQIDKTSKQGIAVGTWVKGMPAMNFKRYFFPEDTISIVVLGAKDKSLELKSGTFDFFSNNPNQSKLTPFSDPDLGNGDGAKLNLMDHYDKNKKIMGHLPSVVITAHGCIRQNL